MNPTGLLVLVLLIGGAGSVASPSADGGGRVLFETDFEHIDLPAEVLRPEVFGWEQDYRTLDRPLAMAARIAVGGPEGTGRCLSLPVGGGNALLISRRIPDSAEEIERREHAVALPGERLTIEASARWDDLGPGRWELGIRFTAERDEATGRPIFSGVPGDDLVSLFGGEGASPEWRPRTARIVVPLSAVAWRLELRLSTGLERREGTIEFDAWRVTASPRAIVRWRDPLRGVDPRSLEAPVEVVTVGLPTGDYEVQIAVLDSAGEIFAADRLARYVDDAHPIILQPDARFLAARRGGRANARERIRTLVVRVLDAEGSVRLHREEPFLVGAPPFEVGRRRSRHGLEVVAPLADWVVPFDPVPVLLVPDASASQWPEELTSVPESQRVALLEISGRGAERIIDATAPLFGAVPRWFLREESDAARLASTRAALAEAAPDLRLGVTGAVGAVDPAVSRLITVGRHLPADRPRRFSIRLRGADLGADPVTWAATLFGFDAAGVDDVYLTDPLASVFRRGRTLEEGFAPQPPWLAWTFCRGYLGSARCLAVERWLPDVETLLYQRDDASAVVLIADGPAFRSDRIELRVTGTPRAFDATGSEVELTPAEGGRLDLALRGRFLLVEGVDLALERTGRSLAIGAVDDGFRLTVENHLGGRGTIEPTLELPEGFRLRGTLEPRTVEAGERATWNLAIDVPPSAGIEGTEWTRGTLTLRRPSGDSIALPFARPFPLESSRVSVTLAEVGAHGATVRIENRETAPVSFHLYLQAGPGGRGERTYSAQSLGPGESRAYDLPLAGEHRSGGDLWVGINFLDGDRGYFNRTFPLP